MNAKKTLLIAATIVMALTFGTGTALADHHGHHRGFHFGIGVGPFSWWRHPHYYGCQYYSYPYYVSPPLSVVVERPVVVRETARVVVRRPSTVVVRRPASVIVHPVVVYK
jgi:hypothetical protein